MSENQGETVSGNDPVPEAPADQVQQPTTAQVEAQAEQPESDVVGTPEPNDASKQAAEDDAKARIENPNVPVTREAREDVAGESTDYLKNVSG